MAARGACAAAGDASGRISPPWHTRRVYGGLRGFRDGLLPTLQAATETIAITSNASDAVANLIIQLARAGEGDP